MQYCSTGSLKALACVSRACGEEARKTLYKAVSFREDHPSWHTRSATHIRDLGLFHQSLCTNWTGWQFAVQSAHLRWSNGVQYSWREIDLSENESYRRLDELVKDTACLLSTSTKLRTLHLTVPRLDSTIPFLVPRITSLRIPITGCIHDDPDFFKLLAFFQIPSLRYVILDSMLRPNCVVPEKCRKPRTSNVTELEFVKCGPISKEISDLLSWPRDLQKLCFSVAMADGLNRYAYDSGSFSMAGILDALSPLEDSLQDLSIIITDYAGSMPDEPLQDKAFQSFKKLKRLHIPLELLFEFLDDDYPSPPYNVALSLGTRLPYCLQELVFDVDPDLPWITDHDVEIEALVPSNQAKELFEWLLTLAEYKSRCFPNLKKVHIVRNRSVPSCLQEDLSHLYFPLQCRQTEDFLRLMQFNDIEMVFI